MKPQFPLHPKPSCFPTRFLWFLLFLASASAGVFGQGRILSRIGTAEEFLSPSTGNGALFSPAGVTDRGEVVGSVLYFITDDWAPGDTERAWTWTPETQFAFTLPSPATSPAISALNPAPFPYTNVPQHGLAFCSAEPGGEILAYASNNRLEIPGLLGFYYRDPVTSRQFMRWVNGAGTWLPFVNHPASVSDGMEYDLEEYSYSYMWPGGYIAGTTHRVHSRVTEYRADPPYWMWQGISGGSYYDFLLSPGGGRQYYVALDGWSGQSITSVNRSGRSVGVLTRPVPGTNTLDWTGVLWDNPGLPQPISQVIGQAAVPVHVTGAGEIVGVIPIATAPTSIDELWEGRLFLWLPKAAWGLPAGLNWLTPEGSSARFGGMNDRGLLFYRLISGGSPLGDYQWSSGSLRSWNVLHSNTNWTYTVPSSAINNQGWVVCWGTRADNGTTDYLLSRPLMDLDLTVEPKEVLLCDEFELTATVRSRSQLTITDFAPTSLPQIAGETNAVILGGVTPNTPQTLPPGGTVVFKWRCRATRLGEARFSVQIQGTGNNTVYRTLKMTSEPATILRPEIIVNRLGDEPVAVDSELCGDVDVNTPGRQTTLRAAIQMANAVEGPDVIRFDLPLESDRTITLGSPLPPVTEACEILGTSQPGGGWVGVNASSLPQNGTALELRGDVTVKGLAFTTSTAGNGRAIQLSAGQNTVAGCRFGQNVLGQPTSVGIGILTTIGGQQIGGSGLGEGNTFEGGNEGIHVEKPPGGTIPRNVIIEGNRFGQIGEGLKRGPANAVVFINVAGSRIGGSSASARNLFVGSKNAAVICIGTETTENDIVGNWFGLSEGGNAVSYLHFNGYGIGLAAGAHHNRIGGPSAGSRNVISGSDDAGICFSTGAHDNTIEGNWIGLDASGTSPADNGAGIWIIAGFNNRIGGSGTGQRNILSGNRVSAIRLGRVVGQPFKDPLLDPGAGLCAGTYIEGNWIGLDHSGTRAVPNGRSFNGGSAVDIARFATGTIIGGDTPERRNVISGNAGSAIVVDATVETAHGIFGNRIGTSVDGLSALPNQGAGLSVIGERAVVVGGIGEGQQNQIAYNRGPGVSLIKLKGGMPGVELEGNLIHDNDPAGSIALANARSSNDAGDADTGPNGRQNWPLLLAAANLNGVTAVAFDLSSFARGIPVRVDVFSASGGGGKTLLGTTTVTTGADPEDRYVVSAALQFVGSSITALATTTDGTSEFSSPIKVVSGQDSDGDGLPDALEREVPITPGPGGAAPLSLYQTAGAGSPSPGDRNADGIADETQANVASVQIPDDGEWITVATTAGRTLTDVVGLRGMDVAALPDSQQVQPGAVRFTLGGATGSAEPLALWLPPQPATPTVWRLNGPAWSEITGLQVQPIGALWKVSFTLPAAPMGSDWLLGVGQPVTPLPAPVLTLLPPELQTLERPSTDSPVSLTYDAPVVEPPPQGWVRSLTIVLPAGAANWTLQTSSDLSLWENLPLAPALGATVVTLAYPVNEPARFFRWRQP